MIECGWCGQPTQPGRCGSCRRDPAVPWLQRDEEPPLFDTAEANRRRLAEAHRTLGREATVEQLAEHLDVSPRTVRRWQQKSAP